MTPVKTACLTAALLLTCKTAPAVAPAPATPAPTPDASVATPAPAPEPVVTLPAATPLPAMPGGLAPLATPRAVTAEQAELGWQLFFETRLSKDNTQSCESCHHIEKAYTSGNALDTKVGGARNKRNAPSVLNLAWHSNYYWDGRAPTLEAVSLAAWKGQLGADPETIVKALNESVVYRAEFKRAFGGQGATVENVPQALAAFFTTLQSGDSAFDKFSAGDKKALTAQQQQGWAVFQKSGCGSCHVPPMFSDYGFHAIGLGDDAGRKDATKADADQGKFKTPSLRNVALTAPYFHDGSAATLEDAIALMAKGSKAPGVDPLFTAHTLSAADAKALKAFLESLSGTITWSQAPVRPAGPWTEAAK